MKMSRLIKTKLFGIGVILIIDILLVGCASLFSSLFGQEVSEPITYSEQVELPNLSQDEAFNKAKNYFDNIFRGSRLSNVQFSDQNSGIIRGKLVVDGIQHASELYRYNSIFTVDISDEYYKISFSEPTTQKIGFISEQAKEMSFQNYLRGYRLGSSAMSPLTSGVMMPENSNLNRTNAEIRAEWERENVFSSSNPSPERPAENDFRATSPNFYTQWERFANDLKNSIKMN